MVTVVQYHLFRRQNKSGTTLEVCVVTGKCYWVNRWSGKCHADATRVTISVFRSPGAPHSFPQGEVLAVKHIVNPCNAVVSGSISISFRFHKS